jgi:hypothetical protein
MRARRFDTPPDELGNTSEVSTLMRREVIAAPSGLMRRMAHAVMITTFSISSLQAASVPAAAGALEIVASAISTVHGSSRPVISTDLPNYPDIPQRTTVAEDIPPAGGTAENASSTDGVIGAM